MGHVTARVLVSFTAAFLLSGVFAGQASADVLRAPDRDDAPGRLDVRFVVHGHWRNLESGERLLTHRLATYETWRPGILRYRGRIEFRFDVDEDWDFERRLSIGVTKGSLYAEMTNDSELETLGYAKVWRPGSRSVKVKFPPSLLGAPGITSYRWYARTAIVCQETDHVVVICGDNAPARGDRFGPPRPLTHQLG